MPIQIGVGLGTEKDQAQAIHTAVKEARLNLRANRIDLAIVLSAIEFAHPAVLKTIAGLLGQVKTIGCTSFAIISDKGIFRHGLAIILLSLPEGSYLNTATTKEIAQKTTFGAGRELGEKLLHGFQDMRRNFSVIFSEGLMQDGSSFIDGLQEKLGRSFPLAGGSASDNLAFKKTYLYYNQEILNNAASGMLWAGKVIFGLGTRHGWKPLGKPHRVTNSRGNMIYEIDGAPAVKMYQDYLAYDLPKLKRELKRISIFYPIGIYLSGEKEYLLRNIISIHADGSLLFQGDVPQDSVIRLMIGTKESCLSAAKQAADEAKREISSRKIDFAFVFDSVSRYILLGREADRELEIVKSTLGRDVPMVGFYTYGEQAPLRAINYLGRTYFHNQTITVLAVGS